MTHAHSIIIINMGIGSSDFPSLSATRVAILYQYYLDFFFHFMTMRKCTYDIILINENRFKLVAMSAADRHITRTRFRSP